MNDFQLVNPENPDLCDPSKSQWYLDHLLAEHIVEWAMSGITEHPSELRALEPSAGRGALAMPLRAYFGKVVCCEIDPQNAEYLVRCGFETYTTDFLKLDTRQVAPFELAVMNPPFEGGQTEEHILHALKFCDRVVCHCPLTTLAGQERRKGLWSQVTLERLVIHASRPKYSGSKTGGATDMVTINVTPDYEDGVRTQIEWWA